MKTIETLEEKVEELDEKLEGIHKGAVSVFNDVFLDLKTLDRRRNKLLLPGLFLQLIISLVLFYQVVF